MWMCSEPTCLVPIPLDQTFCVIHRDAVLASQIAKKLGTCGRCKRVISAEDYVSRTMRQDKHKKTGATRFSWVHAVCNPAPRAPSRAARKKAPKPLFSDLLLEVP